MTATMNTPTTTTPDVPATSTLPDGDALANDILAATGSKATRALLRKGGTSRKAGKRKPGTPPRVMFQPQAWTMGGRVD